jgi:hypothetical protein
MKCFRRNSIYKRIREKVSMGGDLYGINEQALPLCPCRSPFPSAEIAGTPIDFVSIFPHH